MKKWIIFIFVASVVRSVGASYVANRDFLSVAQGARANAMGEAYVAVADDASAMYWNAAGMTQLHSDEFAATYSDRYESLSQEALIHYTRRGVKGMWGFGYVGSYVKDIPVTSALTDSDLNAIQTGTFQALEYPERNILDHAFMFSYARPVTPDSSHSLGTTIKVIYRDILSMVSAYGTAIDLGYHYAPEGGTLRFGLNAQNAASLVSYIGDLDNIDSKATATESYLPTLRTGIAYQPTWRVLNGRLLFALDTTMLLSFENEYSSAGVEYSFGDMVALRAGKIFNRQDDSSEDYALGMGVTIKNLVLDFSFLTNELGETTRGTIRYKIGGDYTTPARY